MAARRAPPRTYDSPEIAMRGNPDASWLSVADGMTTIGVVIDTRDCRPRSPSFAFDARRCPLGSFPDRVSAARAISASRDHERDIGNAPQSVSESRSVTRFSQTRDERDT